MKIILTGATGFVGREALIQLIEDSGVDQVTCLARRQPEIKSEKVRTVLLQDFTAYHPALAKDLAGHSGCIWTLGGKASDLGTDEFEKITTVFTLSLANTVAANLAVPFRFCYLSGMGADPTETARLPWERLTRHMKGRTERMLEEVTRKQTLFHATAFRPAGILPKTINPLANALLSPIGIRVDVLCRAMIKEVKNQTAPAYRVLSNSEIKSLAN